MVFKGCFTILLLCTTCIRPQSTLIPLIRELKVIDGTNNMQNSTSRIVCNPSFERIRDMALMLSVLINKYISYLDITDLKQLKNVCKKWQIMANEELEKRHTETKIVNVVWPGNLDEEDLKILRSTENRSRKSVGNLNGKQQKRCWRPKLMLLFQDKGTFLSENPESLNVMQNISVINGKCFMAESSWGGELGLIHGTAAHFLTEESRNETRTSGCILPEALLKHYDVDVIFPKLDMFRSERSLFQCEKPEANKKLFADYFGWKVEVPIKFAIILARELYDPESRIHGGSPIINRAEYRARQVRSWLMSMPEAGEMRIFSVPINGNVGRIYRAGNGKFEDTAVILFGGDLMLFDCLSLEHTIAESHLDYYDYMYEEKEKLKIWKVNIIDKWPQNIQKIAFLITQLRLDYVMDAFRDVFDDDIQLIMLSRLGCNEPSPDYQLSTFVIVGFPKF